MGRSVVDGGIAKTWPEQWAASISEPRNMRAHLAVRVPAFRGTFTRLRVTN